MTGQAEDLLASLSEVAQRFAGQELVDDGRHGPRPSFLDGARWAEVSSLGWPALLLPEDVGGFALQLRHLAVVTAAFARHGIGHPLTVVGAEVPTLLQGAANSEQRAQWLEAIARHGQLLTSALWDAGQPFQLSCVNTSWTADGDGYRLDGTKLPVAYATMANAFLVLAREGGTGALALFVVDATAPGLDVAPLPTSTSDPTGEVHLTQVRVPAVSRLASGDIAETVLRAVDVGAVLTTADLTIAALRGLELSLAYVKEREQFGQPIGAFQAVHHHCADMYRDVEMMRILCARLLDAHLTDTLSSRDVSVAKAKASATSLRVLEMAHQLHGGVGFYDDYPLELLYRRSLVLQGDYGSSRWHRSRLTRQLQDDPVTMQRSTIEV